MRNKLFLVALAAGLAFLGVTSAAQAGNPPDEAFGDITSAYEGDQVTFNVFELGPTRDRCRGKGTMEYRVDRGDVYVYFLDLEYANVQPEIGKAWFAGIVTRTTKNGQADQTNVGRWFDVVAWDTPDGLSGNWVDGTDPEDTARTRVCEEYYKAFGPITAGGITIQIHPSGLQE